MSKKKDTDSVTNPEGGVLQPDGSYTFPDETIEAPVEETDEEREAREKLALAASEQASFASMPREQGTVVEKDA